MVKLLKHITAKSINDDTKLRELIYATLPRFFEGEYELGKLAFVYHYLKVNNICSLTYKEELSISSNLNKLEKPSKEDMRYCYKMGMQVYNGFSFEDVVCYSANACKQLYLEYFSANGGSAFKELLEIELLNIHDIDKEEARNIISLVDSGKCLSQFCVYGLSKSEVRAVIYKHLKQ